MEFVVLCLTVHCRIVQGALLMHILVRSYEMVALPYSLPLILGLIGPGNRVHRVNAESATAASLHIKDTFL